MKYVATLENDIITSKGINYTDFVDEREIELTEEQYNTIPIPCKLINGEFIPCDFPESNITTGKADTPTTPSDGDYATTEDVNAIWDSMAQAYNEGVNEA